LTVPAPDSRPVASIVIVNYNGLRLLEPCLTATQAQARAAGAEIVLVDNGSVDGSVELVHTHFPEIRVIESATNEGFAGGCNVGVRQARSDLIVLLNNDAVPDPGWLDALLKAVAPADVAIACSVVYDANYPAAYALGTGSVSVIGHPIPNVAKDPAEPFYATGGSLIFKRQLLGEPFDGSFFAYFEDTVLSWRARLHGWRVVRTLSSTVQHLGSATASQQPDRSLYYYERNKVLMLLICFEQATLVRIAPLYLFDAVARLARDCWLLASRKGQQSATVLLHRYLIHGKALLWLATHPATIARLRAAIQNQRNLEDAAITPFLSGKIFDDMMPTRGERLLNFLSVQYCRLAGIRTAELAH
jgi:GT2 family glycosyltransferase